MRVIIAGGRDFNDYDLLNKQINKVFKQLSDEGYLTGYIENDIADIEIISGKAKGADTLGEKFAKDYGIKVKRFSADWNNLDVEPCVVKYNKYGRYNALAGLNRNRQMAEYASQDKDLGVLIAFWDNKSTGTKNMIKLAEEYGLRVFVVNY